MIFHGQRKLNYYPFIQLCKYLGQITTFNQNLHVKREDSIAVSIVMSVNSPVIEICTRGQRDKFDKQPLCISNV